MEVKKEPVDDSTIDVSNSSGSKDLSKTLPEEAFNNFLQGKRHMLVQDYLFAVQSLATACELYVKHFGELAIECGEVYFLYGKALFRLSQQQAGILGGALNEGSNEEENSSDSEKENENENDSEKNSNDDEGEENEAEGEENEAEGEENETEECEKEEKEPSESTDSPPAAMDEGSSEVKVKTEPSDSADDAGPIIKQEPESDTGEDQAEVDGKAAEGSDANQEVEEDDLELAWNTLETAKSIFKRKDTVEAQLKVADILLLLAEISMESDNNMNAINDLKQCLNIQKKHLKPDDRVLAETYYQMGLALMLEKIYPLALENFRETQKILTLRKENLKNKPVDDADGTFAAADIQAEIADLESILVDIKEKVDDTEELISNKKKELEESAFGEAGVSGSTSATPVKSENSTNNKPVTNITHLLKRKKPDEGTSEENAKRLKPSGVFNGDSKVTASETSNVGT